MDKVNQKRLRKVRKIRAHIRELRAIRLSVHRTSKHIYAQVLAVEGGNIIASASTLDKSFDGKSTSNVTAAEFVGNLVAKRAMDAGVKTVAFDRAGYKYHGRVKALAEAARAAGLEF
jgi:large subunit ribosomal protein L18